MDRGPTGGAIRSAAAAGRISRAERVGAAWQSEHSHEQGNFMGTFDNYIDLLSDEELDARRAADLGPLGLDEVVDTLKIVRADLRAGNEIPELQLPTNLLTNEFGTNFNNQLSTLLSNMSSYGPDTDNHTQQRQNFLNAARALRDTTTERLRPLVRVNEAKVAEQLGEIQRLSKQMSDRLNELKKQQDALAQTSVSEAASGLSRFYDQQAKNHGNSAKTFMIYGGVAGVVLTGLTVLFFVAQPPRFDASRGTEQWIEFVRGTTSRLLLLSIAGFLLAFCARNYRVNMHLETLNRRRYNALETFGLFQAGVTSEEARNLIVGELVRAVFQSEDTGYLGNETDRTVIESPVGVMSAMQAMTRARPE